MQGIALIIAFLAAIIGMVALISRWKVHPFPAILGTSLLIAVLAGLPWEEIPAVIGNGFGNTFASIGIVIILGALIGEILEKTGAALRMAEFFTHLTGENHPEAALLLMGWIVSIPVFCDSAFVILDPIRQALIRRTRKSSVSCTIALSLGLVISHCLIPPTPGPAAAADLLFRGIGAPTDLLLVMGIGAACSLFPLIASYFFSLRVGKTIRAKDEEDFTPTETRSESSDQPVPPLLLSVAPIFLPILLMAVSALCGISGSVPGFIRFLGDPAAALAAGLIPGIFLLLRAGKLHLFSDLTEEALRTVGPVLFVTAAGGVLGEVIAATPLIGMITEHASLLRSLGMLFPFLLAAVLKTAQGSSTAAMTISAAILAPLMKELGLVTPVAAALTAAAIASGSIVVSHANDSYFWVTLNFGKIDPKDGYASHTLGTLIAGVSGLVNVMLLSWLFC